nr:ATP-binding cassette domain-containing protein [Corynebacterium lactis]
MSRNENLAARRWRWRYLPLVIVVAYALVVPMIWPAPSADFSRALQAPSGQFIAGTDHYGFDLWTRTALGLRVSLFIGLISALCATAIGLMVGLTAAVRGGLIDRALMRMTDAVNSIPHLILSVVIVALFRGSIPALVISIAVTHWSQVARIVRSTVLAARESEYVAASYGAGADSRWVLRSHLFPVALGQAAVSVMMLTPHAVWHESALSFLGLGLQPDFPSLGTLMDQARGDILTGAWWVLAFPGVALLAATLSLVALVPRDLINASSQNRGGVDADAVEAAEEAASEVPAAAAAAASAAPEVAEFPAGAYGVRDLAISIPSATRRVDAVAGATLQLRAGRVHGLIGGSGSGKSTLGRALCGQVPAGARVSGTIFLGGREVPAANYATDLPGGPQVRPGDEAARGCGGIALIPQAPASSFTPVRRVGTQIQEILDAAGATADTVEDLLARVSLDASVANYFPHQLSGGMARRAAIAAALATGRNVLVADEPTSALDPELTLSVLRLLRSLADDGYTVLLISHDVEDLRGSGVCDELSVMRLGRIVEHGPAGRVLQAPRAGYTRALLAALPSGGMKLTAGFERG